MNNIVIDEISNSEEKTIDIANKFANMLKKGDIVILSGKLGSGKTRFVMGIGEFFGVKEAITSPSFTIVNEYMGNKLSIFHIDLYRLTEEEMLETIGLDDYREENGIILIEWGEMLEKYIDNYYKVEIKIIDENKRSITIRKLNGN